MSSHNSGTPVPIMQRASLKQVGTALRVFVTVLKEHKTQ
jgi:hypothetical protein